MASAKREVHEGSEFKHAPDLTVKPFNLSQSQRERKVRNKNKKYRGEKSSDSGWDFNLQPGKWPVSVAPLAGYNANQ